MITPFFVANWKMHKTPDEAEDFVRVFLHQGSIPKEREVGIAPAMPLLSAVANVLRGATVKLVAQNMYFADEGAYTGETSARQLAAVGCSYVIIGHSERRQLFGETNEMIAKKVQAALRHGLTPILCVGETLAEREAGQERVVVRQQLEEGLSELFCSDPVQEAKIKIVIAYEPVWAIGTGHVATSAQAQKMHEFIRGLVPSEAPILYGGSVKVENAAELLAQPNIDGFLVGGASLDPQSFWKIINI